MTTTTGRLIDPAPPAPEKTAPPTDRRALSVSGLSVAYPRRHGRGAGESVLRGVDLEVTPGQILGVIGETGSGKTTLARAVVGLAPVVGGRIEVAGIDVGGLRKRELRDHRRSGVVQYMFQDPLRSLDPDLTVADLVGEPLAVAGVERAERRARVAEALGRVGLDADALGGRIPAQLSGGQRQRVSLARAIVTRPALLLADEPVSALDASNRNHVLRLLDELRRDLGVAVVVISHDLSSLAGIADRIAVLYRGRLVEQGPTAEVLARPLHPYTALLTASAPRLDRDPAVRRDRPGRSGPVSGEAPAWAGEPGACVFAHRCPLAEADCRTQPGGSPHPGERSAACHHPVTTSADRLARAPRATT
ncbi:oligopeptide/dipeptide ABC transporter, ATP-binding protein, C-terminal domain-containing protein [Actinacidiphila alni]|uniref:Oligopeptide/dipeptide ABC transporter, ATP-binding protein, C-terminal domain-containing protein n=1 Tax=Actinacidiphila alni TaxID=380248 RepID=A0A1I2BVM7_9ACTN|nr:ABC transporter ATP-binding protein [Actinacidiphila alni]SFE60131.1 oligopeptide/dipeptide ABC transporter, ATP-binding protein, C-terminal domain-containing protein [Actinacidiphila alni]